MSFFLNNLSGFMNDVKSVWLYNKYNDYLANCKAVLKTVFVDDNK